jgi:hypothetical protein
VTTNSPATAESHDRPVRWLWIVLTALVGGGVIVWGAVFVGRADAQDYWAGVAANAGTSVVLAGFLFWLERRFAGSARQAVTEAAQVAASGATAAFQQEAAELRASVREALDDLEGELQARRSAEEEESRTLFTGLREEVSFERLAEAFRLADEAKVLSGWQLVVPAGDQDAPRISVAWMTDPVERIGFFYEDGSSLAVPTAIWGPEERLADAFDRFRGEMVAHGYGPAFNQMTPSDVLRHVVRALDEGLSGRRGDEGAWRSASPLREVVTDGWVLTDAGLEVRRHGVVLEASSAPSPLVEWRPDPPEGLDPELWKAAVLRLDGQYRSPRRF